MKRKWIIASILVVVLVALCGASLFAVWQGTRMVETSGMSFRLQRDTTEAQVVEEKNLTVSGPVTLTLNNDFGDISVITGTTTQVQIKTEKTAWGANEEDAQKRLEELKVIVEQNGNSINISVQQLEQKDVLNFRPNGGRVTFTVTVPEETSVTLDSVNGELTLSGMKGDLDVQSDFGSITISGVSGTVTARTTNGAIVGENISSDSNIALASEFGGISLDSSQASALEIKSTNGKVGLQDILLDGKVTIQNEFGDLTLIGVKASAYDIKTQNGKIKLDQAQGSIVAQSSFGDVEVLNVDNGTIDLSSTNGAISFSGSLGAGPHSISSDFGNITLNLPAETGLSVDLQTDFGKISSDFDLTVSGALEANHWVGKLNGGGETLNAKTQNGNITINSQ